MAKEASRIEDMSPDGRLSVIIQDDGDVIVEIQPSSEDPHVSAVPVSVEFCASGGHSHETWKALHGLFKAMQADSRTLIDEKLLTFREECRDMAERVLGLKEDDSE